MLSDDDKRQIMHELSQGKTNFIWEMPFLYSENEPDFDKDYPTFDDFAQRPSREPWQFFGQFLHLD